MAADIRERTALIKSHAIELGFLDVGFTKAEKLDPEAQRLENWLEAGHHGTMDYLKNNFEKRVDPSKLVPGATSVISLLYNYYTEKKQGDPRAPKISKYAYGRDYHKVIKKKLKNLLFFIQENFGEVHGRCFVDSAPLLERDLAKRAGLGWVGKNTLLINPRIGSYFFLAEIVIDLELIYDIPIADYCGTCTRCIDACPTDAIGDHGYTLDSTKCISYLTIESKDQIPDTFHNKMENWVFGCDICQDVCPWNRFATPHEEIEFEPKQELLDKSQKDWIEIDEEIYDSLFAGSAVKRTKFSGFTRNLKFLYPKKSINK